METPSVTTFKLSRHKKRGLFLTTVLSALIGTGALYAADGLQYGEGRFVFIYISEEGINDISTGNRIGTILWKDVDSIKIMDDISNLKRKYIVLKVRNPNEYIDREPTRSKKRSLELRLQYYGSPICISSRALDCTFEELKQAVFDRYDLYKASHKEA